MTSLLQTLSCADDYDPESLGAERARQLILDLVEPVAGSERVALRDSLGRVLAEDVISPHDVPGHDNSAMDGYALRFADLAAAGETALRVAGTTFAGRAFAGRLGAGECVRIMTGGVIPADADTVVIQEVVRAEGDRIIVPPKQRMGQNVRRAGEDLRAGSPAIRAGKRLRPAELGLIASLGLGEVAVRHRPHVAFFSTGDELCSIGTPLKEGEVYDSNRYTLRGMLARLGCEIVDLGVVRDDPAAIEAAFRQASEADAIVTSGGVSVGEEDHLRPAVLAEGRLENWQVAMKPGKPLAFGAVRRCCGGSSDGEALFVGLPGNPVSSWVTFVLCVSTVLRVLQGLPPGLPRPLPLKAAFDWPRPDKRREFVRVRLNDAGEPELFDNQSSGVLTSVVWADGLVDIAPGQTVARGDAVRYLALSELIAR